MVSSPMCCYPLSPVCYPLSPVCYTLSPVCYPQTQVCYPLSHLFSPDTLLLPKIGTRDITVYPYQVVSSMHAREWKWLDLFPADSGWISSFYAFDTLFTCHASIKIYLNRIFSYLIMNINLPAFFNSSVQQRSVRSPFSLWGICVCVHHVWWRPTVSFKGETVELRCDFV